MGFLEREVPGWEDDDIKVGALFKGFSGQREDWQGRLEFWKSLIIKFARHSSLVVINAEEVQYEWFLRDGLLPLCINNVLHEMLNSGELQQLEDDQAGNSQQTRLGWLASRLGHVFTWAFGLHGEELPSAVTGKLVVVVLLKEKVADISKTLAETSWKSDCLVTMKEFVELCGTIDDARAGMDYLVKSKLARHIYISAEERIEGLKISLVQSPVAAPSEVDYNLLQLQWTNEKMKQRLDALEERVLQLRNAAVASLKTKDKQTALRKLRSMKAMTQSRDKCADMLSRIHEILDAISDAEATKRVSEAIQLGNRAMKEHHVTLEEVEGQLKELDESILLSKQIGDAIGGTSLSMVDEEELEDEFAALEKELHEQPVSQVQEPEKPPMDPSEVEENLVKTFSKLEVAM